jgi:hypothetical protein
MIVEKFEEGLCDIMKKKKNFFRTYSIAEITAPSASHKF